jgi:hypothetical protein
LPTKHHAHPVELSGKQANFNSLRSLEKAVRDVGGPERFRHAMVDKGYGHIAVNDEEFRGKSYIGLKPDTFAVKNSRANGGRAGYAPGGAPDIPPMEDPRNWLELGGEKPISPSVDQRLGIGTDAGEAIVQPLSGQGMVSASQNPRVNMSHSDVLKQIPQLETAAQKVAAGQMSGREYQSSINQYKPVSPWEAVPKPATYDELRAALKISQQANIGRGNEIPEGHPVGLRLDIPAYTRSGTWAPTIHDKSSSKQTVLAHEPVAMVNNATFSVREKNAMRVATGDVSKSPFATIDGKWSPVTSDQAMSMANAAMKSKEWRQVGMDPHRHSFFYDRQTQAPIVSAERVIQVGPLVLAHNPTYGKLEDFKYKSGGTVVDRALMLTSKKASSQRGRP